MAIAPTSSVTAPSDPADTQSRLPVKTLSQDDFLKLLVAQMTSQDPLNPKSDIDMIPQMVSFNELEQSKSMQTDIQNLRAEQQVLQANSLLGRTVDVQDADQKVTGQVTAVQMEEGTPKLLVNGHPYDLSSLLSITPSATGN
jgi:flagellar basal-body rod modification protein FlgD